MSLSLPFKREGQDPEIRPLSKRSINMASPTRSNQPPAPPALVRANIAPDAPSPSGRRSSKLHQLAARPTRSSEASYSVRADDIICKDPSQCPFGPGAGLHSVFRHDQPHGKKKVKCADKTFELLQDMERASAERQGEAEGQTRPGSTSKRREPVGVWMDADTGLKMEPPKEAVRTCESYCRTKTEEGETGSPLFFGPYHRSVLETMIQDIPVAPGQAQRGTPGTRVSHSPPPPPPPPPQQENQSLGPFFAPGGQALPRNPVTEQTEAEKREVTTAVMFHMANYHRQKESNSKQPAVDMQREGAAFALNSQEHFRQAAETARQRLQQQKLLAKKAQEEEELKKEALRRKELQRQEFERQQQQQQQQQREYQLKLEHKEARARRRGRMEERITRHLEREVQMKQQQQYELEQKQRQEELQRQDDFAKQRQLEKHRLEMKQRQEFQLKQKQQQEQEEHKLQVKQQTQDYVELLLKKQQECNLKMEKRQEEERQKLQQKQAELQRQEEQAKQRQREEYQLKMKQREEHQLQQKQQQQQQQQQQDLERRKKASQELKLKQQQRHEALLKSKQELEALQSGVRQREAELMQKQRQEYEFKERQKREEQKQVQLKRQAEYEARKQQIEASDVSSKPVYNPEQGYADMIEMIKNWQLSATKGIHSISEELGRISATAAKAEEQIERDAVSIKVRLEPETVAKAAEVSKASKASEAEVEANREIPPFSLGPPLSPVIDPRNWSNAGADPSQGMVHRLVKQEDDGQTFDCVSYEDAQDPAEEFIITEPMSCCENGKNCKNCDCQKPPQAGIARALPLEFFDDDFLLI
ncbi:hypothetical protein HER10_EVM0003093 [Colletotrichum scovillei]|uniref:Uncharacterized protein n=1 Tax=Colletotrichum scovillei TaxID=1209932 RepID=A0A9P7U8F6_9PEZI|nr:uncharacterized protein HER10_EVM0003093 [Colletotrichum scovillei]KAF4780829.1 hypothetical protein HER10_EVM0003093 [Colletotrichum scovillei]KAG7039239.1 hypothetical protein JMJ78_0005034 [Colletotrichum scovillei]KAG7041424.1 hypothetical protein JMJ77_0003530 [Colletotrichum scovillei]KAG7061451.1 hypothetical protein JMJ76_0001015 [Colletotrichum scovillei]